jgi:hypothetical protein
VHEEALLAQLQFEQAPHLGFVFDYENDGFFSARVHGVFDSQPLGRRTIVPAGVHGSEATCSFGGNVMKPIQLIPMVMCAGIIILREEGAQQRARADTAGMDTTFKVCEHTRQTVS